MPFLVKDIMEKQFDFIKEEAPLDEAIQNILNGKVRKTGHKTISLMVTDDLNKLVGVLTMFDILYHIRPAFLNHGIEGSELVWNGKMKQLVQDLKGKKVKQVMSRNIVSAKEDDHIMTVLDRMVKNKYRRLPVMDTGKPVGIIYISDIYYHLFKGL